MDQVTESLREISGKLDVIDEKLDAVRGEQKKLRKDLARAFEGIQKSPETLTEFVTGKKPPGG